MRKPSRRVSSLLVLGSLAACGGSGGGAPTTATLQGVITVPQLSAGGGRLLTDRDLDNVAHQAQPVGAVEPGDAFALRGRVGGDDPLDIFRVTTGAARLVIDAPADARVEVFDATDARCVLALEAGQRGELRVLSPLALDIAIGARQGEIDYVVDVVALKDDGGNARFAPLPRGAGRVASDLEIAYLGAQHEMVAGEIVVEFPENEVAPASVHAALGQLGLVRSEALVPGPVQKYYVTAPLLSVQQGAPLAASLELETCAVAQRAMAVPGVRSAGPNYIYRAFQNNPNDPGFAKQWHYTQIKAQQAWALFGGAPGSTSVIAAIIDTGIVLNHPDLAGRLIGGHDMISDPTRALDGDGIDANPDDVGDNLGSGLPSTFHGTHVGGTVGAATNNSVGVAGMDWSCKLMPIRVLGKGGGTLDDIIAGIRFAAGLSNASGQVPPTRADVINMSLGGTGSAAPYEAACNAADAAGVVIVVAAGNDNAATLNYPASYPVCISVGAIRFDKQRAPYSNFANTIDVVAPGGDTSVDQNGDGDPDGVLSCMAAHQNGTPVLALGYSYSQGTSMACPHVAGLAALVKGKAPGSTNAQIRAAIENNTETVASGKLVDTFAAVQAAGGNAANPILRAANTTLALTGTTTTGNVALSNVGNTGTVLTLIQGQVTTTYQQGNNWLTSTLAGGAGTGISHTRIDFTANPAGLANGKYQATVSIQPQTAGVNTAQILVTLTIGSTGGGSEEVFIVVADSTTFANMGQGQTNGAANYAYSVPNVAVGNYLLVAGTDRDNDDFIGDEGELFGIWPSTDSPLILSLATPGTFTGLNFPLQLRSRQQSVGGGKFTPIRIRR